MQSGVRYVGELHLRIKGSEEEGKRYIPQARLLMGETLADAEVNQLGSHMRRKQLPDGTVLVAEKIGAINRVTIVTPGATPPREPLRPLDDVVVWARELERPDGIDPENPQQILRADVDSDSRVWTTFFFNADTPGHATFPGNKGTFGGMFPDGLTRAGNVDWVSEGGQRINWYGPQCRYFFDGYVQPRSQYGKWVFMLGQALLDTDQYAVDSDEQAHGDDRWVLGAALKRIGGVTWLYVVQSTASNIPLPSGTVEAMFGQYSAAYAGTGQPSTLYRYRLLIEVDVAGVPRFVVSPNSREPLVSVADMNAEPWVFNTSCTEARCWQSPGASGWWALLANHVDVQPSDVTEVYPGTTQSLHVLTISDDGASASTQALSITDNGQPVVVASDWVDDERLDLFLAVRPGVDPVLIFGGAEWTINSTVIGAGNLHQQERRYLLFADLRSRVFVFLRVQQSHVNGDTTQPNLGAGTSLEVFRGGARILDTGPDASVLQVPLVRSMLANSQKYASLAGRHVNPYFHLYGLVLLKEATEEEAPGITGATPDFAGAINAFGSLPLPSECYFGAYHLPQPTTQPVRTVAMRAFPGFSASSQDFDGHYSMVGCASSEDTLVLSMHDPLWKSGDGNFRDRSISYVSGSQLSTLTGVAGTFARYHPIWQIGKPPRVD